MARLSWSQKADLLWRLSRDNRLPPFVRVLVFAPALYLISPIDLLPDLIPFIGQMDDAVIFALIADVIARFAPGAVLEEHLANIAGTRH
jgi:uncharacterized membrane protein YkvA (DUF1232 family)